MNHWIALLRGINVGGRNIVPMKELKTTLDGIGFTDVSTYIQSGNIVFGSQETDAESVSELIRDTMCATFGFAPEVMTVSVADFRAIVTGNPYPDAVNTPKTLHVFFFSPTPDNPDIETMSAIKTVSERFTMRSAALYLHAPEGIGKSKLAARVEKLIGVTATARNWRTVAALSSMVDSR